MRGLRSKTVSGMSISMRKGNNMDRHRLVRDTKTFLETVPNES